MSSLKLVPIQMSLSLNSYNKINLLSKIAPIQVKMYWPKPSTSASILEGVFYSSSGKGQVIS